MHFATRAIRAGQTPEPTTKSVIVPIYQTATFVFDEIGKHSGYEYTRTGNPTRTALEQCLASLEEAKHGASFASGSAATDAVLYNFDPGDHIVAACHLYGGTSRIFEKIYRPRGIKFSYVEGLDAADFEAQLTPETRLVWLETPANPMLEIIDIQAVADLCRSRGITLVVDNTFATPYFQQPLLLGADIVLHSTTKYIGGHSDVLGGTVLTNDDKFLESFRFYQNTIGAVPGPMDCWLTLRGVKTLAVRMRQHEQNAIAVAKFLSAHPMVSEVIYPGLPSHPQHILAKRQMRGFGAMVTFRFDGGRDAANAFVKALQVFLFAESLGGVESLACHPTTMSHGALSEEERQAIGITEGTIRLSVGIEDERDLLEDLDRALAATKNV